MTRLLFVTLALVTLLPTLAHGRPPIDYEAVAFLSKDGVQIGQRIRIVASEFGDLSSCGETFVTVYRALVVADDLGDSRKFVRLWGADLSGVYSVENLWKGDGESDCAVLARVSPK